MGKAAETDRVLGDYEVGYCRPPVATRFTTTGNPKGRPKGSKNYATILREKLNAKVTVREGGRRRRMSKAELGMTKLANQFAEKGDWKAFLALMRVLDGPANEHGPGVEHPGANAEDITSAEAMVAWLIEELRGETQKGEPGGGER